MKRHKRHIDWGQIAIIAGILLICLGFLLCSASAPAQVSTWDATKPDGETESLSTWDDYLREVKEDFLTWYAVEHSSNGSHAIPYLARNLRLAYSYAVAGTMVVDSSDGYLYRYSGSAWVRVYPIGREATYTADATPSVTDYDRLLMTSAVSVTDFDDAIVGQRITILTSAAVTITDNTHISLDGDTNYDMVAGDILRLEQFADGIWYEIGRATQ